MATTPRRHGRPPRKYPAVTGADVPLLSYDWTTQAGVTASGVVATRTGATIYARTSEQTVTAVGNNTPIFENFGLDESDPSAGGGLWVFDTYTNTIASPYDFSTGWTTDASVSYTANAGTSPDGTSTADKVKDTLTGARQAIYRSATTIGTFSVWVMDAPGDAPTADGAIAVDNTPTVLVANTSTNRWKRITIEGFSPTNFTILPAGGAVQTATGAVLLWGAQYINSTATQGCRMDTPTADSSGATGICTLQPASGDLSKFLNNGAIDVEFAMRMAGDEVNYFTLSVTTMYAFRATDQAGREWSLRWGRDASSVDRSWILRCAGTDVLSVNQSGLASWQWPNVMPWRKGDEVRIRCYLSGSAARIRVRVNGCQCLDTSAALFVPSATSLSAFYFGSNGTTASSTMKCRFTSWKSFNTFRDWNTSPTVKGVICGDSTVGQTNDYGSVSIPLITISEARAGYLVGNIAKSGDTIAGQYAKWLTCAYRGDSNVRWVAIFHTVNDINAGTSAATISASLQTFINDIATQNPTAKIFIFAPQPCDTWAGMTAGDQAIWIDCYKNVRGDGPNPLTGATVFNTAISDSLNTSNALAAAGSNTLKSTYDRAARFGGDIDPSTAGGGDHVHANWVARGVIASALRTILVAQGVGPP